MQKFVTIVVVLLLMALLAGCGGGSTTADTPVTTLPARIALNVTDVAGTAGKKFYVTPVDSTSLNGYFAYQINVNATNITTTNGTVQLSSSPAKTGEPVLDHSGTWSIDATGVLVVTDTTAAPSVTHNFTCIQKEASYFLVYDENFKISRFYFDVPPLPASPITLALPLIQSYQSLISSNVPTNDVKLGGSVQGTALSTFSNVSTAAGSAVGTAGLVDGTSTAATFNHPLGITTDGTNLFVADYDNNVIRKIVIGTWTVTRLAGSGAAGNANSTDGTGDTATFYHPTGITTDGTYLYVTDTGNNTIRKVDKTSGATTLIAGSTASASGAVDAPNGTDARFNQPYGITTDGTNLYVADYGNDSIRKVVISSGAVLTIAGSAGSIGTTDGTGTAARFRLPTHITTDGSRLYVVDFANSTIRQIVIATGEVTTLAGSAGNTGSVDGTTSAARFNMPNGITTDGVNLYVTDSSYASNNIRKVVIATGFVSTISGVAGNDSAGYVNSADGAPKFNGPAGITTDGISLFVADSLNNAIRRIQ